MTFRSVLLVAGVLLADAARMKKSSQRQYPGDDCSQFSGTVVEGRDVSLWLELACKGWPEKAGPFPFEQGAALYTAVKNAQKAIADIKRIREDATGTSFCWKQRALRPIVNSTCDMESDGKCYGACPYGYKPAFLLGRFAPICTTLCKESTLSHGCGLGCAKGFWSCTNQLLDQVGSVASAVGELHEALTGKSTVALVGQVLQVAGFALDTLPVVIKAVEKAVGILKTPQESAVMTLVILIEYLADIKDDIGLTKTQLVDMVEDLVQMMLDMRESEGRPGGISPVDVAKWIVDNMKNNKIFDSAVALTKAFTHAPCEVE